MSRLTRTGRLNPSREIKFSGARRDKGIYFFPVQLATSRIGNLTRLIHTLLYMMTILQSTSIPQYSNPTSWTYFALVDFCLWLYTCIYRITVGFSPILYCWSYSYATTVEEPIKSHEGFLSLQPVFPPKRFGIKYFPSPGWLDAQNDQGLDTFIFFFKQSKCTRYLSLGCGKHDCSPIPVFFFLYLKTQTVTHIRKNAVEYLRQWNGAICVIYNLCQRQKIR